jgi:F420H(2)-dependent quinone reductase
MTRPGLLQAPTNPDWYYDLLANPEASVGVGIETIPVRARLAQGDERARIWEQEMPYAQVQRMTDPTNPPGQHNYWKAEYIAELTDQAVQTLID